MRKGRKGNFDKVFNFKHRRRRQKKKTLLRDVVLVSSSAKFENLGVISSVLKAV